MLDENHDRIATWSKILGITDINAWPEYWTLGEKELDKVSDTYYLKHTIIIPIH